MRQVFQWSNNKSSSTKPMYKNWKHTHNHFLLYHLLFTVSGISYCMCLSVIYSKNTDESLDECRRMQTSVDKSLDECRDCRRFTRRMQTNVDECRRIKKHFFDSRKSDTWSHFVVVTIMQQQTTSVCEISILQFYL